MTDILLASELDEREVTLAALEAAEEQLQSLCASHAGTFVSVERRGRALQDALQELQNAITSTQGLVQTAQTALDQEEGDSDTSLAVLAERHRVRRRTLLQHSSLLELLELPSLMDACVRSNLYEDALSIATFANTLQRRHKDQNLVVGQVIQQIRSRQSDLRRHLLQQLKLPVTMPQCLEVVTALRRLNSIDLERHPEGNLERLHHAMELRLQVDFLEARDAWLESRATTTAAATTTSLTNVPPSTSEQLLDAIERYRTRVFEVATQFNAIFRSPTGTAISGTVARDNPPDVSLLTMWMARRIQSFLQLLGSELVHVTETSLLRDALEASVFFATSMGRLGADFTARLPILFEPRIVALVEVTWRQGLRQLQETLQLCREAGVASPLMNVAAEAEAADVGVWGGNETDASINRYDASLAQDENTDTGLQGPQMPPRQLLSVPPLARFVNVILTGLNELRRCLLPGTFPRLRQVLDEVLNDFENELATHERLVLKPGFRGEAKQLRDVAARFKVLSAQMVNPYLRGSLEAALGCGERAEMLHRKYYDAIRCSEGERDNGNKTTSNSSSVGAVDQANPSEPVQMATAEQVNLPSTTTNESVFESDGISTREETTPADSAPQEA